ncbi:MAG: glycosyltransferase family 9 protein [Verrucomicrobiota bacterium]
MGKILVIRGGALGDFILTLPTIQLLREGLPKNHIEILGYRPMIDLAVAAGHADAVRSMEYGPLSGFFAPGTTLDEELCAYFESFDLIVNYLYDPDDFFHENLQEAGAKTVLRGLHKPVEGGGPAAAQLAVPLEQLALYLDDPAPVIRVAKGGGIDGHTPLRIAIHPGSGSPEKNWSIENWAKLGLRLASELKEVELLLVTGEVETGATGELEAEWSASSVPFSKADQWPLEKLAGALEDCALFLGHDSGVSHLAAACGCPCVLLFGPTDPEIWAPRNERVTVISEALGEGADTANRILKQVKALRASPESST